MADSLNLNIPSNELTTPWIEAYKLIERGEQIAAAFDPKAGVQLVGSGANYSASLEMTEVSLTFFSVDLEQALTEFPEVGRRLQFPAGSSLTHFGPGWETSFAAIRTVATW